MADKNNRRIKYFKGVPQVLPKDVGLGSFSNNLSRIFMLDDGRVLNVFAMITGPNGETDCDISEIIFEERSIDSAQ